LTIKPKKPLIITDNCAYRINGICTTDDIGGVEVSTKEADYAHYYYLVFENHNSFAVNVIFEYETEEFKKTGTIVLKANEKKQTASFYYQPSDFKLITRELNN
jgi:hypothetical protein